MILKCLPSWKLTYPTWGKGKSSSNMPYQGDMLIPWRVYSQLHRVLNHESSTHPATPPHHTVSDQIFPTEKYRAFRASK